MITLVAMVTLVCTGDDLHDSGCIELEYIYIGGHDNTGGHDDTGGHDNIGLYW